MDEPSGTRRRTATTLTGVITPAASLDLGTIRARMGGHVPATHPPNRPWQAATAVVIAPCDGQPAVAFIRRAERPGDRWSGDMALPGGVRSPHDADLADTARRETHEEIGVPLPAPDGRLDDHRGRTRRGLVAAYVFVLDHLPELEPNPREVAEALWIPLTTLFDPAAATTTRWAGIPFPAVDYDGRVIWGLTHRIVQTLGSALDIEPVASAEV